MFDEKLQTLLEAREQLNTVETNGHLIASQNTDKTPKKRKRSKFGDDTNQNGQEQELENGLDSSEPPDKRITRSQMQPVVRLQRIVQRNIH